MNRNFFKIVCKIIAQTNDKRTNCHSVIDNNFENKNLKIAYNLIAKYLYDPEHVKNPHEYGLINPHKTEKGWSDTNLTEDKENKVGGSTGAKCFKDKQGNSYVVKSYRGKEEQAINEYCCNSLYKDFGVNVPDSQLYEQNGKYSVVNKYISGLNKITDKDIESPEFKEQVLDKFAVDCLFANWDVVGLEEDNLLKDENNNFYRIDNGGSLNYRAQGEEKKNKFSSTVEEINTLRDEKINFNSAKLFKSLTDKDVAKQINNFPKNSEEIIKRNINNMPNSNIDKSKLEKTLLARLQYMRDWSENKSY